MKNKHSSTEDPIAYLERLLEQRTNNLRKTNEELALLLELIHVIPYECSADRTSCTTYIHKSVKKITGFTREAFLTDPEFWTKRIHSDDKKQVLDKLNNLKAGDKLSLEYRWQLADESYRWFSDHFQQILNKKGEPDCIRGYWQDITELKK